jgi:acyl transferase domain-containing protein/acyl carrier protein
VTVRSPNEPTAVAIVGIGCRFPGGIADAEGFWRVLRDGVDAITEIPANRIDVDRYYDARQATPGRMVSRRGGFLGRIEDFDAEFFGISPREAERMDPQQRLLLETSWEAFEDAGIDARVVDGASTGVFVGQWLSDFESRLFADPEVVDFYAANGSGRYATSGRISYAFGLRGASLTVDTGCSSALVAVHLAVRSIRSGESRLALAGGVNVILQPHITIAYSQSRMIAPDGRCKFGDASGDGYVRSEGAGMVLLKALPQALADGDRIYAVIRGSATNNDGHSSGSMGTPSRVGQEELLRRAYADAGVEPRRVGYIEAHGTGTRAGDPVELGALATVLREGRDREQRGFIGSVKTNLGHTEAAAGVAGLIKLALSLHHRQIPRNLHFTEPNPAIPWSELPFAVATELTAWPKPADDVRVGGVNSFGVAGTNAHVVLEEAPSVTVVSGPATMPVSLLVLSAKTPQALRELASRYRDLLATRPNVALQDVCWNAAKRRTPLEYRAAFVATTRQEMLESLASYATGDVAAPIDGVVQGASRPRMAFVCPGHGAQWVGMARQLIASEPVFRAALEECDAAAQRYVSWSVMEQILADPGAPNFLMDRLDVVQPVLLSLTVAYARLLAAIGITPDALVGQSVGEAGAAHLAGVIDLDWAMRITCRRSMLMQQTAGRGAMALVDLAAETVSSRLREHGIADRVTVGVVNSPRSCVISGDPQPIRDFIATLEQQSVFCRMVKVDVASHSAQMEPVAASLVPELAALMPTAERVPIYSTLLARKATADEFAPSYWGRNIRDTVRLGPAIGSMLDDGITMFVEIGPHPVVLPSIEQTAAGFGKTATTLPVARRDETEHVSWLRAAGTLWCAGFEVNWDALFHGPRQAIGLPSYPWQRERHWTAAAELRAGSAPSRSSWRPDPAIATWFYQLHWTPADPPAARTAAAIGPALIVGPPAAASALAAAFATVGTRAIAASRSDFAAARGEESFAAVIWIAEDGDSAFDAVRLVQSLLHASCEPPPRTWFVTRGAQIVGAEDRACLTQAALWGAARVIAEEHPELWGGLIDLPAQRPFEDEVAAVIAEVRASSGEDQVAIRDRQRFVLRLAPLDRSTPTDEAWQWRPDGAYLLTGGLGEVGLHLAGAMAAEGARRLILAGRTGLPPREQWSQLSDSDPRARRVAAIRELEAQGVAVHVAAVDVADEERLTAFLAQYAAEAYPPIRGVVHAAGALDNKLVRDLDEASFEGVMRAKLHGAQLLDRLLPDLDLFVLCSSTGAFLAQPGQANYAAANAALDAIAHNRRRRGGRALSIQWGVWQDTGLVKDAAGQRNVAEMARQGVRAFTPEQGRSAFAVLIRTGAASAAVLPIDWATFGQARAGRRRLYADVLANLSTAPRTSPSQAEMLAETDPIKRRQILESIVRDAATQVLKVVPSRLDSRKALGDMGLNSLMAMELRNRLEASLGRSLSATLAWNYPTVDAIVQYLASDTDAKPAAPSPHDELPARSNSLLEVNELSDEEAALALRSRVSAPSP